MDKETVEYTIVVATEEAAEFIAILLDAEAEGRLEYFAISLEGV